MSSVAEAANPESGDSKVESKKDVTMEVDEDEDVLADMQKMGTNDITARTRLLDNEVRIMKSEIMRLQHEMQAQKDKIKENTEKIKVWLNSCKSVYGPPPLLILAKFLMI